VTEGTVVLIVEDDILQRLALAEGLREQGFMVREAANAAEAVSLLQGQVHADILLSDIRMPGPLDGLGLARYVRAHHSAIKIAVISGDLPRSVWQENVDLVLSKPMSPEEVGRRLTELVGGREPGQAKEHPGNGRTG
jgi:CheY-like chemotaxis protein